MTNAEIEEYAKRNMCPVCNHKPNCNITACGRRNALFDAVDVAKNVKKMLIEEALEWIEDNASKYINQYSEDDYSFDMNAFIKNFKQSMEE